MKSFSFGRGLSAAATLLILAGCASEAPWGTGSGEGSIKLDLATTNDVTAAVPAVRAVSSEIATPPVADFKVKVSKSDGSFSQTFSSVKEFVDKDNYSVGTYEIEAWYGDPESQGFVRGEDYEYAYYYGKITDVTVLEGQTTNVNLEASLANSAITIEYTEAFKKYFTDWQTSVQTDGHEAVNLGSEEGMSYVVPGNVNVIIQAELQNGKSLRLNPATFVTEPRHWYKMRYNVYNGEVGGIAKDQLVIEFDESLNEEPIVIDLTEELENTPAPVVKPEGFEDGQNFVTQSGTPFNGEVKFNVSAMGGIKEAKLTVESDTYNPAFLKNGVIDLCQATEKNKADMQASGIKAVGFFRNPGEMAQLDLTELCRTLPDGQHKFILQVKDKFDQVNEPISVTVACVPVEMSMTAAPAPFGEGYVDVTVTYNGPDPTAPGSNPFSFRCQGNYGFVDSEILSISKKETTRAFESHDYVYRISVPDVDRDEFEVRAFFGEETGEGPNLTTNAQFVYPDYQVQLDPMTQKLRINVMNDNPDKKTLFFHKLRVFVNGNRLNDSDFRRIDANGLIVVYGLQPETEYRIQTTLQSSTNVTKFGSDETIRTAKASPVPNGDFSDFEQTINKEIQVGGNYKWGGPTYSNKCSFKYSEPTGGWASINKKTFYEGSNPQNSWFMVASTYIGDTYNNKNTVVIRTVGYSHSGTLPSVTSSSRYYNPEAPNKDSFTRVSGELFLGTYSFDGTESRQDGFAFDARPTSLSFNYKYEPHQSVSRGSAEVIIYSADGTQINQRKIYLYQTDGMVEGKIVLHRYPFAVKPAKIWIRFLSSDLEPGNSIETKRPMNNELDEGVSSLFGRTLKDNSAHAMCIGSVLTVSNLRFNYGEKQND
jgi:hypothetical protein